MKLLKYLYNYREFILLSLLFITLEKMISGRQLYSYLSPDYHFFVYCAVIVIFILSFFALLVAADRNIDDIIVTGYVKHIIFIFLVLFLNVVPDSKTFSMHVANNNVSTGFNAVYTSVASGVSVDSLKPDYKKVKENYIDINNDNFYSIINQIYETPERFKGKKLNIEGFVIQSKKLDKGEFIIARLIIFCCAADANIGGLIFNSSDINVNINKDEWLRIRGTLDIEKRKNNEEIPVLKADFIQKIPAAEDPYVYPVYN